MFEGSTQTSQIVCMQQPVKTRGNKHLCQTPEAIFTLNLLTKQQKFGCSVQYFCSKTESSILMRHTKLHCLVKS